MPSTDLVSPGYVNGFAPRDGFPLNPNLWQGCVVALDPGLGITGTTLYDWSGRRNDGALTNLAADGWKYGERGHVVEFNATNDTCRIPYDANYATTRYSWSIWVKSTETGGNLGLISRWQNVGGTYSWVVTWENTGIYWYQAGLTTVSASGLNQNDGKWHHLAGAYDKVRTILYLDGKAVYDIANTGDYTATVQPIYIGGYAGGQDWDGQWRAFGIWNRGLQANEVRQLAADPSAMYRLEPRRLPPPGLTHYTLTCSVGSFALTGIDAGLYVGRAITAESGAFTLTGIDAGLTATRTITAEAGAFVLTGIDAGLSVGFTIACDAGSFALTGIDAGLTAARLITAEAGAFTLTGNDANLNFGYVMVAAAGSFTLTGIDASLIATRTLTAGTGTFTLTGNAATLTHTVPAEDNAGPGSSGIGPYGSRLRNPLTKMFKKT